MTNSRREIIQGAGVAAATSMLALGAAKIVTPAHAQSVGGITTYPRTAEGFGVYNEWGTLREVYVGRADTTLIPEYDPVFDVTGEAVTDLLKKEGGKLLVDVWPEKAEGTQRGLDNLASAYEKAGVVVHRPREYTELEASYLADLMSGIWQGYPADQIWTVGRNVIECQLRYPMHSKQQFVLREKHLERVVENPDARWVQIPASAPSMDPINGQGPYLEGGDILILGDQVLVGVDLDGFSTDMTGARWLQRYLSDDGFKTTIVPFKDAVKIHLLAHLGVPREGLALIYPDVLTEGVPAPLKDYELIEVTREEAAWGGTCIVALDSKRCLLPDNLPRVADELSKRGIEAILVEDFAETAWWGGAIRCATSIVRRDIV